MYLVDNSLYTVQYIYIYHNITVPKYYGILNTNVKQSLAPML